MADTKTAQNAAPRTFWINDYDRMFGEEFAAALRGLGLDADEFARITGTTASGKRVVQWIKGADDIPPAAHLLLELFLHNPANVEFAKKWAGEWSRPKLRTAR